MKKRDLRKRISARRDGLTPEWVCEQSAAILRQVIALDVYCQAACVACYVSIGQEVDTRDLICTLLIAGKQVAVPVTRARGQMVFQRIKALGELKPARFGLMEPTPNGDAVIAPHRFDLMIVPGVVFDRKGNRVGSGGGYYDRFLGQTQATCIGLAYGFQVVGNVPVDAHDLPVDFIVTEKEVITKGEPDA